MLSVSPDGDQHPQYDYADDSRQHQAVAVQIAQRMLVHNSEFKVDQKRKSPQGDYPPHVYSSPDDASLEPILDMEPGQGR